MPVINPKLIIGPDREKELREKFNLEERGLSIGDKMNQMVTAGSKSGDVFATGRAAMIRLAGTLNEGDSFLMNNRAASGLSISAKDWAVATVKGESIIPSREGDLGYFCEVKANAYPTTGSLTETEAWPRKVYMKWLIGQIDAGNVLLVRTAGVELDAPCFDLGEIK